MRRSTCPTVRPGQALDRDRTSHGIHDAGEFHQQSIAGGPDDPAVVAGDRGVDALAPMLLQRAQRADLVDAHEPAVASDIGRQDRRQSALYSRRGHVSPRGPSRSKQ